LRGWRGLPVSLCVLFLGLQAAIAIAATEAYFARAVIISDGDTLWVEPEGGGELRKLRLQGIDAPEICQSGGVAARDALHALVMQRRLAVQVKYWDNYGRGLAYIEADGQDVAEAMVRQGQAWSYRWRRSLGPYAQQETQARQAALGLFSQLAPELPRDFRLRHGSCYAPDGHGAFKLKSAGRIPGKPGCVGCESR
jgi:micrococcal nuclease